MKFINFAEEQIKKEKAILKENSFFNDFVSEFIALTEYSRDFEKGVKDSFEVIDKEETFRNMDKLIIAFQEIESLIFHFFGKIEIPEVILFLGPYAWDGHGIIIKEKSYMFLNMRMMNFHLSIPTFAIKTHLLHELLHAIHYDIIPEFYPGNYKTPEEIYFKKMYAEGMASYLSGKIAGTGYKESLTFGHIDENLCQKWIKDCNELKKSFWNSIDEAFTNNQNNEELWYRLFSIPDTKPDALARGRYGYYYGTKISEKIAEKFGETVLLNLKIQDINIHIREYFED